MYIYNNRMPIRRLRSFNNNRRILLTFGGLADTENIRTFRRENPEYRTNDDAFRGLLYEYNEVVDRLNAEEERLRREQVNIRRQQAIVRRQQARINRLAETQRVRNNVEIIANDMNSVVKALQERQGQNIVWEFIGGERGFHTRQYDLTGNVNRFIKQNNVFKDFQVDSDTMIWDKLDGEGTKGKLYMYRQDNNINTEKIKQAFREGITNCLLTPIKIWIEEKIDDAKADRTKQRYKKMNKDVDDMMIEYKNGVPETEVCIICDKLQIDIDITTPFSSTTLVEARSTKKALSKFRYINTRLDHIEMNHIVNDDNIENVSSMEKMHQIHQQVEESGEYYTFTKNLEGISGISTLTAKYQLDNDYMNVCNNFENETGLNLCKIDDIHNKEISEFVRNGVHYNGTIDFNELKIQQGITDEIKHIDMTKGYSQFKKCKYYNGFLGKITDFRETDCIVGVGMYYITDLVFTDNNFKKYNDKMVMYKNDNIYTDAELHMLKDNGVSYKIVSGCWGVKSIDFDFDDDMTNKKDDGVRYFSKWTGACNSYHLTKSFWIKGGEDMRNIIAGNCEGVVKRYWNGEIQIEYKKTYNKHLSHITAFITAYMRMNVIEQLLHMDMDKIVRICCDGIYYTDDETTLCNAFVHKDKMNFRNEQGETYCSNLDEYELVLNDTRGHNAFELHLGEGGCGKTHYNCNDKGLVRPLFLAPSWKLARVKERETGIRCSVWARAITEDPEKIRFIRNSANVLIWDEVSMMSEDQKDYIKEIYGDMKNILCGDLGFQLPCIDGVPMDNTGFDKIIHHKKDYRCNCPILKSLKDNLRMFIKNKATKQEINKHVVNVFEKLGRVIKYDDLKKQYKINDMILTGTNDMKDFYTDMFKGMFDEEKYYIKSNNRLFSNGEIIIGEKPNKTECEVRHAFTTHSIQGETATSNLFIDSSRIFDSRMFYTAISRAKTIEQIYIIKDIMSIEQEEKFKLLKAIADKKNKDKKKKKYRKTNNFINYYEK